MLRFALSEYPKQSTGREPPKIMVLFMFNPFAGEIMSKFLSNNINIIRKNNSVIAYVNQISSSEVDIIRKFGHKKLIENKFLGISLFFY